MVDHEHGSLKGKFAFLDLEKILSIDSILDMCSLVLYAQIFFEHITEWCKI